jgi:hypothetical protein
VSSSPLTLPVWNKDGEQRTLVVPGPGGTARVCVGDRDGAHASVWRIWATRNHSDVYIAVRDIAGIQKWSLHESGDWRHQWVTPKYALHLTNSDNRIIDQWPQPTEFEDIGWTKAFSIRARLLDLVDYGDGSELPDDVIWLPPPPGGHATVIHIVIARPDRLAAEVQGVFPFHAFRLANGKAVLLTVSVQPVIAEAEAEIQSMLQKISQHAEAAQKIARASAPRITASVVDEENGDRGVWDIAIPNPQRERTTAPQRRASGVVASRGVGHVLGTDSREFVDNAL